MNPRKLARTIMTYAKKMIRYFCIILAVGAFIWFCFYMLAIIGLLHSNLQILFCKERLAIQPDFGNGNGDKTTYHSRHSDISGAGFGKLSNNSRYSDHTNRLIIDTSREDAIRKFNEVDKKKR